MSHFEEVNCLEWDVGGNKILVGDVVGNVQIWAMKVCTHAGVYISAFSQQSSSLYSLQEYVLNDWKLVSSSLFCGEYFLCAAWFHSGKKVGIFYICIHFLLITFHVIIRELNLLQLSLNSEKKDNMLYMEKFTHVKFGPTLKDFGGRPKEGCVLITSSGMVMFTFLSIHVFIFMSVYNSRLDYGFEKSRFSFAS